MTADRAPVPDEALRAAAERSLRRKHDFLQHLFSYLVVNGLFVTIWLIVGLTGGSWFPWPLFPMIGWGIGLAFHAWAAFGPPSRPITDEDIDRKMRRLGGR
jgi:uncharacterized membrane protein YccC